MDEQKKISKQIPQVIGKKFPLMKSKFDVLQCAHATKIGLVETLASQN